jgi:hypothetical protein
VFGVVTAPRAVLLERDAVAIVLLVLLGLVIPPFAVLAGEGDAGTVISFGHLMSFRLSPGWEPGDGAEV